MFDRLDRQERRKPIRAATINQLVEGASWLSRFNVAPGFGMISTAAGPVIYDARPRPMWVKLVGSANPYTWRHAFNDGAGGFAELTGADDGECYEANGRTGLDGVVVPIELTGENWWVFYVPGFSTVCEDPTYLCLILASGCAGLPAYGATVEFKDHTGATVDTCTTDGFVTSLTRNSGGSGYTNGTAYSLGFSGGGGSGAAGTFDVVSGAVTNLILTDGGTGYTSAPTVSFPGAGGGTGASVTANMGGRCCVEVGNSGAYTATATMPGATPVSTSISATCGVENTGSAAFATNTFGKVRVTVSGCFGVLQGAAVTLSQGGSPIGSATTDASGIAFFPFVPAGVLTTITTACSRFTTDVRTVTPTGCAQSNVGVTLSPASGYACHPTFDCDFPFATTLNFTDDQLGSGTMTFVPALGGGSWIGTLSYNHTSTFDCPQPTGTYTITYELQADGELRVSWDHGAVEQAVASLVCPPAPEVVYNVFLACVHTFPISAMVTITE